MTDKSQMPLRLTARAMVLLDAGGVQFVNGRGAEPIFLTYHNLLTLAELNTNEHIDPAALGQLMAERYGADAEAARKFVHCRTTSSNGIHKCWLQNPPGTGQTGKTWCLP